MKQEQVLSSVKDRELVEKRRNQMIKGAITLFKEKGFHRTTTREIAKESGFSIGTLYEYIRTKEDVLFLVCDSIHEQVRERMESSTNIDNPSVDNLVAVIRSYFYLMDEMQEEIVIMYQEVKSLKKDTKEYVLEKEREMVNMLEHVILTCLPGKVSKQDAELSANNIFIQGHMWGFRRWVLQKQFTLEEYIDRQTHLILQSLAIDTASQSK
ncbi:TetR family transcriptional regulator [Virgibacillus profundi]|uniref:TetR family transcriptional regulator n=1 Tax=Virgibacillus profundi TaxID=2024555 RepID=A0A2A2IJ89_9BACI|nr:TetR/AcrR family transcriptional regulator [Virgibacillus profundi]PAV31386.1 TetR family transcriptional regulator [Virgibacillus profundi]PXY55572.1 TetR/AcrR family transcriptional regulator [Virgibacillus profundi]